MSDHDLSFPDLESATIKEMYPEADDTRLLKRLQANWLKYHQFWDPKTKQELLELISLGDIRTNHTNRCSPSGHKFWKKTIKLTWAKWIVMRTHYGIKKLSTLQARLTEEFPRIVPSSWVCPDRQLQGHQMAGAESDNGPLCVENKETSARARQGSLVTSETEEVDDLEAQTHKDSGSRKRAHSVTPTGSRAKRRQFTLPINKPLDQSLPIGPNPGTPSQRPSLAERMIEVARNSPAVSKEMLSFLTHKLGESRSQNNDTHIGTPVPMSNSPLSKPEPTIHHGLQQRKEQGVTGAPKDVLTTSLELIQPADRAAKVQEAAANIERSVNKLTVSMPGQMADMKRSLENLESITEGHREESMDSQWKFDILLDVVKQQQAQIASQKEKIDKMEDHIASQKERMDKTEDTILRVWGKEFLSQGFASQYSQGAATRMSAPPSNQTMTDAKRQHSITNEGCTPVNAGPGIPQPNILPGQRYISKHQLISTQSSLQQGTTDVAKQNRPLALGTEEHSSPTTGNKN